MAETKKFCIHSDGLGYCDILSDDETHHYCVEGPCPHEEIVEYAPVKHGRWVEDKHLPGKAFCSECRHSRPRKNDHEFASDRNYCPNCGADMREDST